MIGLHALPLAAPTQVPSMQHSVQEGSEQSRFVRVARTASPGRNCAISSGSALPDFGYCTEPVSAWLQANSAMAVLHQVLALRRSLSPHGCRHLGSLHPVLQSRLCLLHGQHPCRRANRGRRLPPSYGSSHLSSPSSGFRRCPHTSARDQRLPALLGAWQMPYHPELYHLALPLQRPCRASQLSVYQNRADSWQSLQVLALMPQGQTWQQRRLPPPASLFGNSQRR